MDEVELIQGLINRLDSLVKRVSEDKKPDFYSYNIELESIKNEILVTIRRSFEETDAYMQKLNKIRNPFGMVGAVTVEVVTGGYSAVFFNHARQLVNLLNTMKYELETYGKQKGQSSVPTLIIMNQGSKMALRDYIDHPITVNTYLNALIQVVEESDIPEPDKATLIQQLKGLVMNPYVAGLSTNLVATYIWKALGLA